MSITLRGSATGDAVGGDRGSLPTFVGRGADVETLRLAWREVRAGNRRVALIAGEPGIGKTTLVAHVARAIASTRGWVLSGSFLPDPAPPYAPIAEALAAAASIAPVEVLARHGVLAHVVPAMRDRLSRLPPLPHDRADLFRAASGLLVEMAEVRPLVLAFDDLHRAGRTTVRLLQQVLADTRRSPILFVATYCDSSVDRADAVASLLADLTGGDDIVHMVLEGLPREAVDGILPSAAVVDALWLRAGGNPLFLAELLRHVDPRLPTVDPRSLPQSIDAGIARRLARMDAATRQLLAVGSIVGPELSLDLVARTGEVPPSRLLEAADEAVEEEMIEPAGEPNHYRFVHDVVREAIGRRAAPNRAVRVHGCIASELERTPPRTDDHLERLAFHAAAATPVGGSVSAAAHAARAGDRAMSELAWEEAAEWYGLGLGLLVHHHHEGARLRARLLLSLGEAHDRAGEKVRARQAFIDAAAVARMAHDGALAAAAETALANSPWPAPVHQPLRSKVPKGIVDQHPIALPPPPPRVVIPPPPPADAEADGERSPRPAHGRPPRRVKAEAADAAPDAAARAEGATAEVADAEADPPSAPPAEQGAPLATTWEGVATTGAEDDDGWGPGGWADRSEGIDASDAAQWLADDLAGLWGASGADGDAVAPDEHAGAYDDPDHGLAGDDRPANEPEHGVDWDTVALAEPGIVPASRRMPARLAALQARHSRRWGPEDLDERLRASDEMVALAQARQDEDLAVTALRLRIADRLEAGRLAQADEDIAAYSALANALGDPLYRRDAASYAAMRALLEGRFDDAELAMRDARALSERAGEPPETQGDRDQRYWLALEWGSEEDVAEVEATLRRVPVGRAWGASMALLLARTRRYGEAQEWLDGVSEHALTTRPFDGEWLQLAACALEASALVKDDRVAAILAPHLSPFAERVVVLARGMVCLGAAARLLGLAAASCGDWAAADRHFAGAERTNRRLEAYPALAHTQAQWGWALLAQGRRLDRDRAESLLGQARDLADELEMRRLAADVRVRRGGR